MLEIKNYSFAYKSIGQNKWECLVTNNECNARFGLICFSPEQPKDEEIFRAFSDNAEFKKHFFIDCDMTIIKDAEKVDSEPKTDTIINVIDTESSKLN